MRAEAFVHYRWVMLNAAAMLLFMGVFIGILLKVFFLNKKTLIDLENMPIQEEEPYEPGN